MATIREYFSKAFQTQMAVDKKLQAKGGPTLLTIDARIHLDIDAHATFVSVFIPAEVPVEKFVDAFCRSINTVLTLEGVTTVTLPRVGPEWVGASVRVENAPTGRVGIRVTLADGLEVNTNGMPFSGRVYVYSEVDIPTDAQDRLRAGCLHTGISLTYRGPAYAAKLDKSQRPKAFVCHDSRDKADIALPIALGLQRLLCPVWYDEFSLTVGQSIRESVEHGIRDCTHCILVLSPNFLSNGGWPKREYTMAFTKELVEDRNLVLPVWHGVSRDEVFAYSPLLADRLGISWGLGADEVCRRLYLAIEKEAAGGTTG